MTTVAGLGLTDGFLTVVTKHPDGVYLSSIGLDPRGEPAMDDDNTGGGPGRDSEGDPPGDPDTITVAPNPINVPPDNDPIQLIPIAFDPDGRWTPVTPIWTRNPAASPPSARRLEEMTDSATTRRGEFSILRGVLEHDFSLAFSYTFKAAERSHIYILREFGPDDAFSWTYGTAFVEVAVDLTNGTITYSLDSTTGTFEICKFTVAPAATHLGDGVYRVDFSIGIDESIVDETAFDTAVGDAILADPLFQFKTQDYIYLCDGPYTDIDPTINYDGVEGNGIEIDESLPAFDSLDNATEVAAVGVQSSVDTDTGLLTIGEEEEVFDVIATVGAVSGSVTVTVEAP